MMELSTLAIVWVCVAVVSGGVGCIEKSFTYRYDGNSVKTVQECGDSHIVTSSSSSLYVYRRNGTTFQSTSVAKDTEFTMFVYVKSLLVDTAAKVVIAGCTRSLIQVYSFDSETGKLSMVKFARLSDDKMGELDTMVRLPKSDYLLTAVGKKIVRVTVSDVSSYQYLERLMDGLKNDSIGSMSVSVLEDSKCMMINRNRDMMYVADVNQQLVTAQLSSRIYSASPLPLYVASEFLPLQSDLNLFAFLMDDGCIYSYDYSINQIYMKKKTFRSDPVGLRYLPQTDYLIVVFTSGILFQNVYQSFADIEFSAQPGIGVTPVFGDSIIITFDNGIAVEYLLRDICMSGCEKCDIINVKRVCLTCKDGLSPNSDSTKCVSSCQSENSKPYVSSTGCVSECPRGTWNYLYSCTKCDTVCSSCVGSSSSHCTSCLVSSSVLSKSGECVSACPDYQYFDNSTRRCEYCGVNCQRCEDKDQTKCLLCAKGFEFNTIIAGCVKACGPSFYLNPENGLCQKCAVGCSKCFDNSTTSCGDCLPGYLHHEGKCLRECPDGFFAQPSVKSCFSCPSNCLQCSTSKVCDLCEDGMFKDSDTGECIKECREADGRYVQDNRYCNRCKSPCIQCKQYDECSVCQSGYQLRINRCWKDEELNKIKRYLVLGFIFLAVMFLAFIGMIKKAGICCFSTQAPDQHRYEMAQTRIPGRAQNDPRDDDTHNDIEHDDTNEIDREEVELDERYNEL